MAQFCAYQNLNPATRAEFPYLLDVQSDLFEQLRTTLVVPLCPSESVARMKFSVMNPAIEIQGDLYTARIQEMAGIDRAHLGPEICRLAHYGSQIVDALDFLIMAYR